jgi:hypothetical protein
MRGLKVSGILRHCKRETKLEQSIRECPSPVPFLHLELTHLRSSVKDLGQTDKAFFFEKVLGIKGDRKLGMDVW